MKRKTNGQPTLPPPRKELSDNPVKLCHEIARIAGGKMRLSGEVEGVMSQHSARLVMAVLAMSDGVSQRELVERTHLKPPTVSVIVKRMVAENLAEMRADEHDLRISRIYLTEHGRQTDRQNIERIKSVDAQGLKNLTEEENEILMELLCKIRKNLLEEETK